MMIEIVNLTKSYNGKTKAVENLDLKILDGEIFGFLGPNGAGKTTTINMITGICEPDNGRILINGIDIAKDSLKAKKQFGFVSDNPDVFLKFKGIEYLNFMADMYEVPKGKRKERIKSLSSKLEMENVLGDKIQSYSHGMRQKIVIIGMLIHNPPIWILDEPLTGLDPKSAYVLKEMMKEHAAAGNIVFFSTHVLEVVEKLCNKIAIINKGKILCSGRLDEIKNEIKRNSSLEEIFLEITDNE